jgi:hypothetical protein
MRSQVRLQSGVLCVPQLWQICTKGSRCDPFPSFNFNDVSTMLSEHFSKKGDAGAAVGGSAVGTRDKSAGKGSGLNVALDEVDEAQDK